MNSNKQILVKDIINFLGSSVLKVYGKYDNIYVKHLKAVSLVDADTLDWINTRSQNKQTMAQDSKARVLLVDNEVQYTRIIEEQKKVLIQVLNPKMSILKVGQHFFVEKLKPAIHATAYVHRDAAIGINFYAGANVVIGKCIIGNDVTIYPNVVINDHVIIGNHVTIKPGAILGFDGFGYERDETNNLVKFPQLGNLIIRDNVEIGANTCIDKGALSDTVIGFNTKINNLCHIAHNVVIGNNVVITGHVNISGSTIIEDDVWIAPNASLKGHQRIGKGATIGMGAVVTKDVPAGETWLGNPAKKVEK